VTSKLFDDDWLLAHAGALGDTIENVLEIFPHLRWSKESSDITQILSDGRELTILAFRGRVFGIVFEDQEPWTWKRLTEAVAKYMEIPPDAVWVEDATAKKTKTTYIGQRYGAGVWFFGDNSIVVRLENGIATIRIGLQSVAKEVQELEEKGPLQIKEIGRRGILPVAVCRAQFAAGTRFYDLSGLPLVDERAYWNTIDRELNKLLNEGLSQKDICIEDDTGISRRPTLLGGVRQIFRQVRQIKSANHVSWWWVLRNFFHPTAAPSGCLRKS
jgi:hypothetical protein